MLCLLGGHVQRGLRNHVRALGSSYGPPPNLSSGRPDGKTGGKGHLTCGRSSVVEQRLPKPKIVGSTPIARSRCNTSVPDSEEETPMKMTIALCA